MLTIQGTSQRVCNGLTRRDVIREAGTGLLGTSLPMLLAAEEAGVVVAPKAKSVMFVFLFGGPSQLETFDLKPNAPKEIRGPYQPIASRSPGLLVSDHLPKLAAMSDKYAVIRTMTHGQNDHNACHIIQTGHEMPPAERGPARVNATEKDWPAFGSVVEYLDQRADAQRPVDQRRDFPSFVYLPNRLGHIQGYDRSGQYGGWLGQSYNPLATRVGKRDAKDDPYFRDCTEEELTFRIEGVEAHSDVTLDRLNRRESLLTQFDTARRDLDTARDLDPRECEAPWYLGLVEVAVESWPPGAKAFVAAAQCYDALVKETQRVRDEMAARKDVSEAFRTRQLTGFDAAIADDSTRRSASELNAAINYGRAGDLPNATVYMKRAAVDPQRRVAVEDLRQVLGVPRW